MADVERIDSIYNLAAIQAEHESLQKILQTDTASIVDLYNNLETFQNKSNVGNVTKQWQAVTTAMTGSITASEALMQIQDKLNAQIAKTASLEKQLEEALKSSAAAGKAASGDVGKLGEAVKSAGNAFDQNIEKQVAYRNKLAELRKDLRDLQKTILDQGSATKQQLEDQAALTTKLEQTKIASTDLQRTIRAQIQDQQASAGSVSEMKAKYDQLYQVFKNLSQEERDSDFGKTLGKDLGDLQNKINGIQMGAGNMAQNIGRYAEAFRPAISVLETQLKDILAQMSNIEAKSQTTVRNVSAANPVGFNTSQWKDQNTSQFTNKFSGSTEPVSIINSEAQAYQNLSTKAAVLDQAMQKINGDFTSSRQAMIAAREAVIEVNMALGQTDDTAVLFTSALGEVKNSVDDIKAALNFQAKDAKLLVGLSEAATALVGGVGAAQAAISLLGSDSDETQKKLVHLQEIMLLINGLQQVTNALQAESGAMQLLLAAKAALNAAAQKINTIITREATAAIYAEAEANLALMESYNVVIYTEEQRIAAVTGTIDASLEATAASLGLSLAEDEVAISATGATAAVTSLNATLIATGIGALILAIAAAVGFLIYKIKEWTENTELTIKQQKELNDALDDQLQTLKAINDLKDITSKADIDRLEHQLELEEKSGKNQYAIFAARKKVVDLQASTASDKLAYATADAENKYIKDGLIGTEALQKAKDDYFEKLTKATYDANSLQRQLVAELAKPDKTRGSEKSLQAMKDAKANADAQVKLYKDQFDFYNDADTNATKIHNEQENLRLELEKFTADQRRKLILAEAETEVAIRKDANNRILSDERSTLQQRLAANRSNAQQSRIENSATLADVTNNPSSTPEEIKIAKAKYRQTSIEINRNELQQDRDLRYSYYVRDRNAQLEIYKLENQDREAHANEVLSDEKSNFGQRTTAQHQLYESQRNILGAEFLKDLDQLGLTNEEKLKISKDYESKLLALGIKYDKDKEDEQKRSHEKQIKDLKDFYDKQADVNAIHSTEAKTKLNSQVLSGSIGPAEYERRRAELDYQAQLAEAQTNVAKAFGDTQLYKQGTKERMDAEAALAKAQMDLSDLVTKHQLDNIKKRNDLEKEAVSEVGKLGISLIDAAFEQQLNNIQKQIDKNNILKEDETKRIAASTLGEQQKAAAIDIINRQTEATNEALERRQRDIKIKQAKFDRDVAVAETIEQGAIAAIAALKVPIYGEAEAIAIGIITAAKVAEILARPLPTYGFGTDDHIGGTAMVGDRFERELIQEPGKSPYWSNPFPTIMDLPAHTKVIPPDQLEAMQRGNMFVDDRGMLIMAAAPDKSMKIVEAIEDQTARTERALAKQKKTTIINTTVNLGWADYIKRNIYE